MTQIPHLFVECFIRKAMRERVAHEWIKKPGTLHYRICHKADELFLAKLKGGTVTFTSEEPVFMLCIGTQDHLNVIPFAEAEKKLAYGGGLLIISEDGHKFIAETEAEIGLPSIRYAGSTKK